MDRSVLTIGVAAKHNAIISWQSELSPHYGNKKNPDLLDSAVNVVFPLAGAISATYSRVE